MAELMASARNLVKIYESARGSVQALRGIDLAVERGSVTAIVGPSGSGKSSLLRILAAVDLPSAGEVTLGGVPLANLSERRRRLVRREHVAFVSQRPSDNLHGRIPIGHQVMAAARARKTANGSTFDVLERLGLTSRRGHSPEQLSGGEQQRAGMARALAGRPSILIADEPTAELDLDNTTSLCASIRTLADDLGLAAVLATHDGAVLSTADHVIVLRDGAIQSETRAGEEHAVIDGTGRIQLPPEVLEWFPDRRVRLEVDPETQSLRIRPS